MDDDEFSRSMQGVKRHQNSNKVRPEPQRLSYRPTSREADDRAVMAELLEMDAGPGSDVESGEELHFRGAGIQDSVFRKLRRGAYRTSAELDLHGMRVNEAKHAVRDFLVDCRAQDFRCVRIVHGKGLGSDQRGPVLKQSVDAWLRRRQEVLAFCSAQPRHGGTGAVYVLLRALI